MTFSPQSLPEVAAPPERGFVFNNLSLVLRGHATMPRQVADFAARGGLGRARERPEWRLLRANPERQWDVARRRGVDSSFILIQSCETRSSPRFF